MYTTETQGGNNNGYNNYNDDDDDDNNNNNSRHIKKTYFLISCRSHQMGRGNTIKDSCQKKQIM